MTTRIPASLLFVSALLLFGCHGTPRVTPDFQLAVYDDAPYARVLAASIRNGRVDYSAIKESPTDAKGEDLDPDALDVQLSVYLNAVARFGPESTPEQFPSESDRLAYHLNAYNAIMLRKWLDSGARTAKASDKVKWLRWFTLDRWTIDGKRMTLDGLEQRLIRPTYQDPRTHAALVCGAISCPPLRDEPFRGDVLDAQLDDQMRRWFNDPAGNVIEIRDDGAVYFSKILGWYRDDFEPSGGLRGVIAKYLDDADPRKTPALQALEQNRENFARYDWAINLAPSAATP